MSESTTSPHEFVPPGMVAPGRVPRDRCVKCGQSRSAHYFAAVTAASEDISDALSHVRAREDAKEITVLESAQERVQLLERHLQRLHDLRVKHLGGQP